jgi:disulfide bond formation protein DsbB
MTGKRFHYKRVGLALLLCGSLFAAKAQTVTVDARIDSTQILIGEQAKIKLEVSFDANRRMHLPQIADTLVTGVEVLEVAKPDTQYLNNRQRLLISQEYTVTSFDSALYYLPPFEVMVDNKIYRSKALALNVLTVPVDTLHPDQFFGPKEVMSVPFTWIDFRTIFWCGLAALLLIGLAVYLVIRYRDNKPILRIIKVEPKLPPHQLAMQEIERIKAEHSAQKEDAKQYYTELTDALRTYIQDRFHFNAMEMTSTEIMERLLQEPDQSSLNELKSLFQTADLVKFAKHNPLINEKDRNLLNAIDFINETKVEPDPNEKPQPTEVTVEEKRSKVSRMLLLGAIIVLAVAVVCLLAVVVLRVYRLYN